MLIKKLLDCQNNTFNDTTKTETCSAYQSVQLHVIIPQYFSKCLVQCTLYIT